MQTIRLVLLNGSLLSVVLASCHHDVRNPEPVTQQISVSSGVNDTTQNVVAGSGRCPTDMAWIPKGRFQMGVGEAGPEVSHRVSLDGFCLDKTEVTVGAYRRCVAVDECTIPDEPEELDCNFRVTDREEHPVNCVDWKQAKEYCQWMGKRLPTEAEWEYAAKGGGVLGYPWGDDPPDEQLCWRGNDATPKVVATCPVASFDKEAFGLRDMGGNVAEWVQDWFGRFTERSEWNPSGPVHGVAKVAKGGLYLASVPEHLFPTNRYDLRPERRDSWVGFRCALSQ